MGSNASSPVGSTLNHDTTQLGSPTKQLERVDWDDVIAKLAELDCTMEAENEQTPHLQTQNTDIPRQFQPSSPPVADSMALTQQRATKCFIEEEMVASYVRGTAASPLKSTARPNVAGATSPVGRFASSSPVNDGKVIYVSQGVRAGASKRQERENDEGNVDRVVKKAKRKSWKERSTITPAKHSYSLRSPLRHAKTGCMRCLNIGSTCYQCRRGLRYSANRELLPMHSAGTPPAPSHSPNHAHTPTATKAFYVLAGKAAQSVSFSERIPAPSPIAAEANAPIGPPATPQPASSTSMVLFPQGHAGAGAAQSMGTSGSVPAPAAFVGNPLSDLPVSPHSAAGSMASHGHSDAGVTDHCTQTLDSLPAHNFSENPPREPSSPHSPPPSPSHSIPSEVHETAPQSPVADSPAQPTLDPYGGCMRCIDAGATCFECRSPEDSPSELSSSPQLTDILLPSEGQSEAGVADHAHAHTFDPLLAPRSASKNLPVLRAAQLHPPTPCARRGFPFNVVCPPPLPVQRAEDGNAATPQEESQPSPPPRWERASGSVARQLRARIDSARSDTQVEGAGAGLGLGLIIPTTTSAVVQSPSPPPAPTTSNPLIPSTPQRSRPTTSECPPTAMSALTPIPAGWRTPAPFARQLRARVRNAKSLGLGFGGVQKRTGAGLGAQAQTQVQGRNGAGRDRRWLAAKSLGGSAAVRPLVPAQSSSTVEKQSVMDREEVPAADSYDSAVRAALVELEESGCGGALPSSTVEKEGAVDGEETPAADPVHAELVEGESGFGRPLGVATVSEDEVQSTKLCSPRSSARPVRYRSRCASGVYASSTPEAPPVPASSALLSPDAMEVVGNAEDAPPSSPPILEYVSSPHPSPTNVTIRKWQARIEAASDLHTGSSPPSNISQISLSFSSVDVDRTPTPSSSSSSEITPVRNSDTTPIRNSNNTPVRNSNSAPSSPPPVPFPTMGTVSLEALVRQYRGSTRKHANERSRYNTSARQSHSSGSWDSVREERVQRLLRAMEGGSFRRSSESVSSQGGSGAGLSEAAVTGVSGAEERVPRDARRLDSLGSEGGSLRTTPSPVEDSSSIPVGSPSSIIASFGSRSESVDSTRVVSFGNPARRLDSLGAEGGPLWQLRTTPAIRGDSSIPSGSLQPSSPHTLVVGSTRPPSFEEKEALLRETPSLPIPSAATGSLTEVVDSTKLDNVIAGLRRITDVLEAHSLAFGLLADEVRRDRVIRNEMFDRVVRACGVEDRFRVKIEEEEELEEGELRDNSH